MWTGGLGPGASFGMAGCLRLPALVGLLFGLIQLRVLLKLGLRVLWVLILMVFVESGLLLIVFSLSWLPLASRIFLGRTDGSHVVDELSGVGVGGCAVYSLRSGAGWFGRRWGHLELLPPDGDLGLERCVLFDSVHGPQQSVPLPCSALSIWVWITLMLSVMFLVFWIVVSVVDLFELTIDGDLLTIIERMVIQRGGIRSDL